jgi:hypothetical protein
LKPSQQPRFGVSVCKQMDKEMHYSFFKKEIYNCIKEPGEHGVK